MKLVTVDLSPRQVSRLRRGKKTRIKKGTGFNLLVSPSTYDIATRSFSRGKALDVTLSPEEIMANRQMTPETQQSMVQESGEVMGKGIFGKTFDKFLDKMGVKEQAYKVGDYLKDPVKQTIRTGLQQGANMLSARAPMLSPFIQKGAESLGSLASDYIDDPEKYQKKIFGGRVSKESTGPKEPYPRSIPEKNQFYETLNRDLGKNYGYLSRANYDNAVQSGIQKHLTDMGIEARKNLLKPDSEAVHNVPMHEKTGMGYRSREVGILKGKHNAVGRGLPPALLSQPFGANYQFQFFLPPQYQSFNKGPALPDPTGSGLYL
jgi:hypothetical protein